MNKSTHEEHLSQPLQTNCKQLKMAVTFLTGYNGILNFTNSNKNFYFKKTITNKDDSYQITIPPAAYEIDSLNIEIKRIIFDKGHFSESGYPFQIKPNFCTLGSIIEISPQGSIIGFVFDDCIRNLLGFHETILYKEHNLSSNPVDNLSSDIFFLETNFAQGMVFKGKRSGIFHNWTLTVDPGYLYVARFSGGLSLYMMKTKDVTSSIFFQSKNETNELVSFNGQSESFILSTKER